MVNELAPKTAGNKIIMPQGGIIQVQYTQFTGTNSVAITGQTDTVLTDLTVDITPASASSVIHLQAHIFGEHSDDNSTSWNHVFFFYRDTTKLQNGSPGNRTSGISVATRTIDTVNDDSTAQVARYDYFDTPSTTSQITYKCGVLTVASETFFLNRTVNDSDAIGYERGVSFISATEIAG